MGAATVTGLSSYDDAVPHPGPVPLLAARFAELRAARAAVDLGALRDVVLVVSSSRSGSSMLAAALRDQPDTLALPGELNPYVAIAQVSAAGADVVLDELAREIGRPAADDGHDIDVDALSNDICWRLTAQWPELTLPVGRMRSAVVDAVRHADTLNPRALTTSVAEAFEPHGVRLAAYDVGVHADGAARIPVMPVVEMTPNIGLRAWRHATTADLATKPLVIATPRNAFRLPWLTEILRPARVRVLHLTRNPAATVNGLVDGWHHHGFFTVDVGEDLDITGYSDVYEWGRRWWKFDVPPRWASLASRSLPEVAAEQWRSANAEVLTFTEQHPEDVLRVRYEDLIGSVSQRAEVANRLAEFIGCDENGLRARLLGDAEPVMATATPRAQRWHRSSHDLGAALAEPDVWETVGALGYEAYEELWV